MIDSAPRSVGGGEQTKGSSRFKGVRSSRGVHAQERKRSVHVRKPRQRSFLVTASTETGLTWTARARRVLTASLTSQPDASEPKRPGTVDRPAACRSHDCGHGPRTTRATDCASLSVRPTLYQLEHYANGSTSTPVFASRRSPATSCACRRALYTASREASRSPTSSHDRRAVTSMHEIAHTRATRNAR